MPIRLMCCRVENLRLRDRAGLTVQSGIPLSTLVAQQLTKTLAKYLIFGRGDLGRTPVTGNRRRSR